MTPIRRHSPEGKTSGATAVLFHRRALVLIFAVLATGIAATGWLFWRSQCDRVVRAAEEHVLAIADLRVEQISRWRLRQMAAMRHICQTLSLIEATGGTTKPPSIEAWLASACDDFGYARIVILDRDLHIVSANSGGDSWVGPLSSKAARAVLTTGREQLIDIHVSPVSGLTNMDVVLPVRNADGDITAAVDVEIEPNTFLYPLLRSWPTPSATGETLLVRREGDEVLFLNELRHQSGTTLALRHPVADSLLPAARAVAGYSGVVQGVDYRRHKVIAAVRPVPGTPWFLVAKVDRDEVHAPLRRQGLLLALAGLALIAVCGLVVTLVWRHHAARIVRESERDYRRLFDEMVTGLAVHEMIYDEQGDPCDFRFLQVNPAFETLTGWRATEVVGRRALEIVPTLAPSWIDRYGRVATTGQPVEFEDHNVIPGRYFEIHAYCPAKDRVAVIFQDVTERRRAELEHEQLNHKLQAANTELEDLLYAASHDLRSPLINIEGFTGRLEGAVADLVRRSERGPASPSPQDRVGKALFFIRSSVARMNQQIAGLLQLSRLGRAKPLLAVVDMRRLVDETLDVMRFQIQQAGATIEILPLPGCLADKNLLGQVITNLIDNALKYRDPDRPLHIRVSGHIEGSEAIYEVEDTGIGIAPEHQGKIWNLFHRLSPESGIPGEGIGLNIARRVLDRQKGRIWVESRPRRGSRFCIALPTTVTETGPSSAHPFESHGYPS